MRWTFTLLGVVLIAVGAVWILQGANVLPGSFMTGDMKWAVYGCILAIAGIVVILWARRRPG